MEQFTLTVCTHIIHSLCGLHIAYFTMLLHLALPDGYVTTILILLGLILCHALILFVSILQILQFKVKKLFSSFNTRFTILPLNITISCSLARHHIYASICLTTNDKKALNTMNFGTDSAIFIVEKNTYGLYSLISF